MATPTLNQVSALAEAWFSEPGPKRLDALTARLAELFTDSAAIVRGRIENRSGVYTAVLEFEQDGTVITREWAPTGLQDALREVFCQEYSATVADAESKGII
jgi:hypothetical protein